MLLITEGRRGRATRAAVALFAVVVTVPLAGGVGLPHGLDPARMVYVDGEPWPSAGEERSRLRADLTPDEVDLLARLVAAEARGESYRGQVAVAAVVLNRMDSYLFPSDLAGVVFQPRQFQPVDHGTIYDAATDEAVAAVMDALAGVDPSGGALFFFNPAKANSAFLWRRPVTTWIGEHRFSR